MGFQKFSPNGVNIAEVKTIKVKTNKTFWFLHLLGVTCDITK
jgi:hypothetical protein